MKKLIIVMMLMISALGFSQKNLIDSTEVYRVMPKGDLLVTIYDFDYMPRSLDSLSRIYEQNRFVIKIYYKDDEDEWGNKTDEYMNRVYTTIFSKDKTK